MKEKYFVVTLCNYTEENVPNYTMDIVVSSKISLDLVPLYIVSQNFLVQEAMEQNGCEGVLKIRQISKEDFEEEYAKETVVSFDDYLPNYYVEHITKENGRWFAEIVFDSNNGEMGTVLRYHTSDTFGWEGVFYDKLKKFLELNFDLKIPTINKLVLIKKTSTREIYAIPRSFEDGIIAVFEQYLASKDMSLDDDARQGLLSGVKYIVNGTNCKIVTDLLCFDGKLQLEDGDISVSSSHLQDYIENFSME